MRQQGIHLKQALSNLKARIASFILLTGTTYPIRQVYDFFLRRFSHNRFLPLSSPAETGYAIEKMIMPSITSTSVPPDTGTGRCNPVCNTFPEIAGYTFHDATIQAASCAILVNGTILIPPYYLKNPERFKFSGGHLIAHNKNSGLISLPKPRHISRGIFIIGLGSFNWYHWLIEILPMVMLSDSIREPYHSFPLLVPPEYDRYPSFRESLEIFRGNREVIPLSGNYSYQVGELVVIDSPVHGPFNMQAGLWPEPGDYSLNTDVLLEFRRKILLHLGIIPSKPWRRIYLARSNDRRQYNQDALIAIAHEFGLEVVYAESLTFAEQVRLFHDASVIVGASGAAWSGLLFTQPGTKCLSWLIPEYIGFCAFSNLALIVSSELKYILTPARGRTTNTGLAYNAIYELDTTQFRRELQLLLET